MLLDSNLIYRKARLQDVPQIYLFETAYIDEIEPENSERWAHTKDKTVAQLEANVEKMFVAEVDGKLAGHIYWNIHADKPHIFSIYVLKAFRRVGVARKLMLLAERDIQENGFQQCLLSTRTHNPAKNLFDEIGYQLIEQDNGWFHLEKNL